MDESCFRPGKDPSGATINNVGTRNNKLDCLRDVRLSYPLANAARFDTFTRNCDAYLNAKEIDNDATFETCIFNSKFLQILILLQRVIF